jgi:hypothetical protein
MSLLWVLILLLLLSGGLGFYGGPAYGGYGYGPGIGLGGILVIVLIVCLLTGRL